ncbi:MAG: hypothetical protein GOP50_04775 [Candidatus Heimdallarchaeota archaeon]|nr:hypothetical protein [Candidatus Heimdallarchaeota archaeon]
MSNLRKQRKLFPKKFRKIRSIFTPNILIIIVLSALLFIFALYFTTEIASWIQSYIGPFDDLLYFDYTWTNPSDESVTWYFEVYRDASYYYTEFLDAFIDWWNPYGRYEGTPLDYYLYGPMFIYGLYFTFLLLNLSYPGASRAFLVNSAVKWTAVNFEGLSAVMIYLIIINFSSLKDTKVKRHILGLIGAIAYVFMPINLLYVDAYYFNIPQMTFFTLLTLFLFMKKKYKLSAYSLTIAWLTKQMPLFMLIPLFSYIWKKYDIKKAFKEFLRPFLVSFLIFSIPWIFLTPHLYIGRIFAAGRPLWYVDNTAASLKHGVTFANTILYWGAEGLANFYMWVSIPMLPFILFYGFGLFLGHFNAKKLSSDDSTFIYYITWIFFIVHVFISRGIYKYYNAFLNPFLVITSVILITNSINKFQACLLRRKKGTNEEVNTSSKTMFQQFLWLTLTILLLLVLIAAIYAYNWSLMITIRYLHPAFLLGVVILISPLIPVSYYKAVFKKENYKNLKEDFKEFFKYIKTSTISFYRRIKGLFKKQELVSQTEEENLD